jgi:hypothetical protein
MAPTSLVLSCFKEKSGQLIHNRLDHERLKQEGWRIQKSKAGIKGMAARWNKKNKIDNIVITDHNGPVITQDNSSVFSLQSSVCSLQSSVPDSASNDLESNHSQREASKPKSERPKDEAYEIWAAEFLKSRTVPYLNKKADFIQLSKLRKAYGLNGKTSCPDGWHEAIQNYFNSPLTAYTLADLCTRFDCFVNGEVDRFGKPAGFNDVHQANKATLQSLAKKGFFSDKE